MREKRVLVVSDEATMRFLISETLRPLGSEIETAENSAAAMQQITGKTYHLVVTSHRPSQMNGLALVRAIKLLHPSLPVLVIHTNGSESEFLKSGALICMKEPLNTVELQMISRFILHDSVFSTPPS